MAQAILPLPELSEERQRTFENGLVISASRVAEKMLGGDVWKSSHCMQRFLACNASALVKGKRVIELGAGTGFLSMSVHLLGSAVCISTDRGGNVLKLAEKNLQENDALLRMANSKGEIACCACDWEEVRTSGSLPAVLKPWLPFDVVIAADCIYYHESYARAFLAVLVQLLSQSSTAECLLCQSYRGAPGVERAFFDGAAAAGLCCALISQDERLSPDREALAKMNVSIWRIWRGGRSAGSQASAATTAVPSSVQSPAPHLLATSALHNLIALRHRHGRTQWAFASQPCCSVRSIDGKGLGLVAEYDIEPGDQILSEAPLVQWHTRTDRAGRADLGELERIVASLAAAERDAFFALCDVHGSGLAFDSESGKIRLGGGGDDAAVEGALGVEGAGSGEAESVTAHKKSVAGIWASNAFFLDEGSCFAPCQDGATRAGVFRTISRLNHSCRPCTFATWNPSARRQEVHALRHIRADEELTHSYLGGAAWDGRRAHRQRELARKYRFVCDCDSCEESGEARELSEQRLKRIYQLNRMLAEVDGDDGDGTGGQPPSAAAVCDVLKCVQELWMLAQEEGLPSVWLRGHVIAAMQSARGRDRPAEALEWAERGARSARIALGAASPTTVQFDAIVKAWRHALSKGRPLPG